MNTDLPSTAPTANALSLHSDHQDGSSQARISALPHTSHGRALARTTLPPAVRAKRMVTTVRMLAARLARRLPSHVDREELVSAGSLGLADAYSRRGAMSGDEFEAFAVCRIRGEMIDELRRVDALSRGARRSAKLLAKARHTAEQRLGRPALDADVAHELGIDMKAYRSLCTVVDAHRTPVFFSELAGENDNLLPDIVDPDTDAPESLSVRSEIVAAIGELIDALPERTRAVIIGLYVEGRTLKEIGVSLGVTESRVCQIHKEAIAALRTTCRAKIAEAVFPS
jgi:RNA polymerase sigma factor for flagellar operon FliA